MTFDGLIQSDHTSMLNSEEFGVSCTNGRTSKSFDVIKTDAFIEISSDGTAIIEGKPMFNTSALNDIKQYDTLAIGTSTFIVRDVKRDGIGGLDVYLKA